MKRFLTVLGIIAFLTILTSTLAATGSFRKSDSKNDQTEVVNKSTQNEDSFSVGGPLSGIQKFLKYTGFKNATTGHFIMLIVGLIFIYLAIKYDYEPLLLIPIGTGIIMKLIFLIFFSKSSYCSSVPSQPMAKIR